MANFDRKGHVQSPDFYREIAKKMVLGQDATFDTIRTALQMEVPSEAELLFIGGGGGKEISAFHACSHHWNFTVLDPSEKMLGLARHWAEVEGVQERAAFVHGYVQDLDTENAAFDAITCIAVFHYMTVQERLAMLQAVKKLLKPNGVFVWHVAVQPATERECAYLQNLFLQYPRQQGVEEGGIGKLRASLENEYMMISREEEVELVRKAGLGEPIEIASSLFFTTFVARNDA